MIDNQEELEQQEALVSEDQEQSSKSKILNALVNEEDDSDKKDIEHLKDVLQALSINGLWFKKQLGVLSLILFGIIIAFIIAGMRKKVNVYESFIDGAKEGFTTAVRIIPYLVAILVAIGVFRASGGMDLLIQGINRLFELMGCNTDFVDALPTALMKPLSGSGARGMMVDTMTAHGADSFAGRLSCIFQGSTDTTFYILAVYFGSIGIRHTRHAVTCGLLADVAGILAAIAVAYFFFG